MYKRQLQPLTLSASFVQRDEDVTDFGSYSQLNVHCRILTAGSDGDVYLEHSATGEEGSFVQITSASWDLTTTGGFLSVSGFLRFVRVGTNGAVAGSPVALIDIIAKEA